MKEIVVTDKEANQRLDKFLLKYFDKAPKSFVYKMLRKKRIKYNGARGCGNEVLKKGDAVQMFLSEETLSAFHGKNKLNSVPEITFKALYEDRNILVVDKSAGCLSQRENKSATNSLIDQVLYYLWEKGEYYPESEDTFTPALCNRLDRNTSGVVIVGKNVMALQEMSKALQNGNISKRYLALVKGHVARPGKLKAFLFKDAKTNSVTISEEQLEFFKPIKTLYEPIESNDRYSYLEVSLKTGRPHQIRAHLAHAGYPVVGDKKYGHKGTNMTFLRKHGLNHQFLHAYKLSFSGFEGDFSYLNGKEIFSALPDKLASILESVFRT